MAIVRQSVGTTTTMRVILSASLAAAAAYYRGGDGGGGSSCLVSAFAPPIVTPAQGRQFSSSLPTLHAEQQPNNALLSDLKNLQSKASDFVANSFNDEATSTTSMTMKDELSGMNTSSRSTLLSKRTAPPLKVTPPPPFDPTNPEALIAITKSFIATDFGIQTSQLPNYSTAPKKKKEEADTPLFKAINNVDSSPPSTTNNNNMENTKPILPFYSSSLISDTNFMWVSGNNINDGRTGILNKKEYLAAGRYFDLRSSFPDLEYRAHDFRVFIDEEGGYSGGQRESFDGGSDKITVRFTTLVTGTFRGSSLKLRSKVMEPNGKVMNCPPTSVSITFATSGPEKGKIVKLVTDMVMDRQIGNTKGYSGIAGAAVIAGEEPSDFTSQPPLVVLGRIFTGKLTYFDERYGEEYLPPFPDTVMIQLAKGVVASNFGLDDPDLLANEFSYLETSMGPLNKMKYLEKFSEYGVRDAVRDMDYRIMNYRVDQYNPYRIWVDTFARGTRTGPIGNVLPKGPAAIYEAAPEAMSFSFDDDGYCTRITAAAVLDPLLGNTGGLGGVNGILYATGTPESALKTRSLNHFLTRATKSLFNKVGLSAGADSYKMSDGRVVNGMLPYGTNVVMGLPSTAAVSTPKPPRPPPAVPPKPKPSTPFFAAPVIEKLSQPPPPPPPPPPQQQQVKAISAAPAINIQTAQIIDEPAATAKPATREKALIDANPSDPVTEAFSNAFGITDAQVIAVSTDSESASVSKAQELRDKAREARAEAAEAMERAAALKAQAEEEKKKMLEAKLEEQQRRLQQIEEEQKMVLEAKEAKEKEKERIQQTAEEAKMKKMQMQEKAENVSTKKKSDDGGTIFSFLSSPPLSSKVSLKGKETTPKKLPSTKPSPTLNLFNTSSGSRKSASAKQSQAPERSPTLNIFSSAPKVSSSTTVKKPSPTAPSSRSPTLSLMGVGAPPKSIVVKTASKKKTFKQKTLMKKKAQLPKQTPAIQSPTLSLLGIGTSKESKVASEKSSTVKALTKKSPTLSLFGVGGGEPATDESSTGKVPAKKSPTLSVFGVGESPTKQSAIATASKRPTSNNVFSFFGGGNQGTSETKTKTISSAPKKLSVSDQQVPNEAEARKGTSNNVFGGFFGSSNSDSIKGEESSSVKNRKLVAAKAPKGVPVLKGWRANANNEIQGKVYSSASFRDGEKITTSPVNGRLQSGSLVISKSGSKYWLE